MAKKRKDSSFKEKFKVVSNVVKKVNEQEKQKADERKGNKPKGYQAKKFGVVAFWCMFAVNILLLFVAIFGGGGNSSSNEQSQISTANEINHNEAVEFGKDFLSKYFTWSDMRNREQTENRQALMRRYTTNEIVAEVAKTSSETWNATLSLEDIVLKEMKEVGDNKFYLTYRVYPTYTKTAEAVALEMKDGAQNVSQTIRKSNYIMLKVHYDEDLQKYAIYEMPQFTYIAESEGEVFVDSEVNKLKDATEADKNQIQSFLNTFFVAYASDSKDKLVYFFENPASVEGLNKTMEFVQLNDVSIFEGKKEDEKVLKVNVELKATETGIKFTSDYTLVVKEAEQGYVVKSINDKTYLDELKNVDSEE